MADVPYFARLIVLLCFNIFSIPLGCCFTLFKTLARETDHWTGRIGALEASNSTNNRLDNNDLEADHRTGMIEEARQGNGDEGCLLMGKFVCTEEEFQSSNPTYTGHPTRKDHRIVDKPNRPLYVIEVSRKAPHDRQVHRQTSRFFATNASSQGEGSMPLDEPDRIRIRSFFLLDLLEHITHTKVEHDSTKTAARSDNTSMVFLHPFKFFVTHEKKIREYAEKLRRDLRPQSLGQSTFATADPTLPLAVAENIPSIGRANAGADVGLSSQQINQYSSQRALENLELVLDLFDQDLASILGIRKRILDGSAQTIRFEHLWLLFTVGELVYQRAPNAGSSVFFQHHPPRLLRITQFDGGRYILNNGEYKSLDPLRNDHNQQPSVAGMKGKENGFFIRSYGLDFDGEKYGPKAEALTIPQWVGERFIHELKLFPVRFCRPGTEFKGHNDVDSYRLACINQGKQFCNMYKGDGFAFRHYTGQSVGEQRAQYDSLVVVDAKLGRLESEERERQFPLKLRKLMEVIGGKVDQSLRSFKGDMREVVEETESSTGVPCLIPGCDNNSIIHDDLQFDYDLSNNFIAKLGPSASMFSNSDDLLGDHEEEFAILNNVVSAFVLSDGVWAELQVELLTQPSEHSNAKFDMLELEDASKDALVAVTKSQIRKSLRFDAIEGKGQGVVILLHGAPGLGKTFTAEALASFTEKALYPITCGDLGHDAISIEKKLKKIFQRGHRWRCILLLDEADVFLGARDKVNIERNSVVSVFLRQMEYYSGILILTSNRPGLFDWAVLARTHLAIAYSPLNKVSTSKLFETHFQAIDKYTSHLEGDASSGQKERIKADEIGIKAWMCKKFDEAQQGRGWWTGRQIRNAFHTAVALAESDRDNRGDAQAELNASHFEKVDAIYKTFDASFEAAHKGKSPIDLSIFRGETLTSSSQILPQVTSKLENHE